MDFTLTDDQNAVVELAARILGDRCTPEALAAAELAGDRFDAGLWRLLADADLIGLCLPELDGGGGYGVLEAALLCREVGRSAAPVPLWSTLLLGALPIARHGSSELRSEVLPHVAAGTLVLSAALDEGGPLPPEIPATVARRDGETWVLSGTKHVVPTVHLTGSGLDVGLLVAARTGDFTSTVFLVDPTASGVTVRRGVGTDLEPLSTVVLDEVTVADAVSIVGPVDGGADVVATVVALGTVGICARQAGTCEAALRAAATYTSEREQFGTKIATFQAVAQRLADAYIDTEAIHLTSTHAAWLLDEGRPAEEALAVAKLWATEGAQRVVHAAQHVHGGVGVDTDYPLHRWFRAAKAAEHTLGTAHPHLVALGSRMVGVG